MNTTGQTLEWYRKEALSPPFDPDGMCLMICRTARGIGALYPSALAAASATPAKYRVTQLSDIKPGMVMYFDDPHDSNPYGHIVTVDSVKDDARSLADIVVWTNSVKANIIVRVTADYFGKYWGDSFQFAATWLNGQEIYFPADAPVKPPVKPMPKGGDRIKHAIRDLELARAFHQNKKHVRMVRALDRDIQSLKEKV